MSDDSLAGTIVSRTKGENTIGKVIQSDNLERARENERRKFGATKKYQGMVAVQWYDRDDQRLEEIIGDRIESGVSEGKVREQAVKYMKNNYDEGNVGWHKKGALLVVLEATNNGN